MADQPPEAGNGLLGRRAFVSGLATGAALLTARAVADDRPASMRAPGAPMSPSGAPSPYEPQLVRSEIASQPGTRGSGVSRTPLQHLDGLITPSRLHFERHHSGIPDLDASSHSIVVHGLVDRPLRFSIDDLHRYPQVSAIQFLECSGNSSALIAPQAQDATCSEIHGLISCSEWGGVPLATLLDEAGLEREARWVVAEGADAAAMARSIPLDKALDDAIVALYQNGEPLRPANGYPARVFLPGWEGNASVKWLRSLRVTEQPAMTRQETSKYTDLQSSGRADMFTFEMGVKSVITNPSPGLKLREHGIYQLSGLAWSGAGRIKRVQVSADGGESWADAELDTHILPKSVTRFRTAWRWLGAPAVLMSRAEDETGAVQPTRAAMMNGRAPGTFYHVNPVQAWQVGINGEAQNVYV